MLLSEKRKTRVLVLCTGNSARSILAEHLFNTTGGEFFEAYSAGSAPTGLVNPYALTLMGDRNDTPPPRSKSWNEFFGREKMKIDIVVTVCANAANEICPIFPGKAQRVHWGLPDPAAVHGTHRQKAQAFTSCFEVLKLHISDLVLALQRTPDTDIFTAMKGMEVDFLNANDTTLSGPAPPRHPR